MRTLSLSSIILLLAVGAALAAGDAKAGKAVYDKSCKTCHGAEGQGNPGIAKMLKVTLRHLGSKEVQAKTDAQLKKEAVAGVGAMKPVTLSPKQADDVVAFVRTLKQ